jgi:septum site-determining protein MinC
MQTPRLRRICIPPLPNIFTDSDPVRAIIFSDDERIAAGMSARVQMKGIRDGLLITLGEGEWPDLRQSLLDQIDQQAEFLRGARLALDVGNLILKAADIGPLTREVADRGLTLWAVISNSPTTERSAQSFGLATRLSRPRPEPAAPAADTNLHNGESAVLVRRTLRSGFSVQYAGHVVVVGDVNPGAEIIARGDVLVWGRLRGMVHAGAEGDERAVVCALDLSPTQLRIAGQIALTPKRRGKPLPEMARLNNGQVVAEPWDPKREKL